LAKFAYPCGELSLWWCRNSNLNVLQDGTAWRIIPFISHLGHLEGEQPYLGDLLTMVIIHLLTGMILQVVTGFFEKAPNFKKFLPCRGHGTADFGESIFRLQQLEDHPSQEGSRKW